MTVTSFPKSPRPRKGFGEIDYRDFARLTSGGCYHGSLEEGVSYLVREDLGIVECTKCKERLNPIWVLKQVAFLADDAKKRHEKKIAMRKKKVVTK